MAKVRVAKSAGSPGIRRNIKTWKPIRKPMRAIRSVRTLRKVDESKGATMPESKNLLQRAGVGTRQQAPRIVRKANPISTSTTSNRTRVKTPRPAPGGIRSPFRRGRGS